jgi:hypothetical protein
MAPQEHSDGVPDDNGGDDEAQYLFVIRHGDRWDYHHPEWLETAKRCGDPPLSTLGHQQARETGLFLDKLLAGYTHDNITWLSSPFLRTLQTSDDALNAFQKVDSGQIAILPEYSVFEMDGHDGQLHKDLPDLEERKCYFPRLDESHKSLFVPELPGKPMLIICASLFPCIVKSRLLMSFFVVPPLAPSCTLCTHTHDIYLI